MPALETAWSPTALCRASWAQCPGCSFPGWYSALHSLPRLIASAKRCRVMEEGIVTLGLGRTWVPGPFGGILA